MGLSELIETKRNHKFNTNNIRNRLYKGACVKIKNSQKIFQVVGINPKSEVCWIRELPFDLKVNKTFSLKINEITLQTFCPKNSSEM